MAFEHHPLHVRKAIAFWCTLGIAFILFIILVLKYGHKREAGDKESSNKINTFYTTILNQTQSYFSAK